VVSNRGATGTDYETNFGDLTIVPRFLLSESTDFTQSFNVAFRVPTGKTENAAGAAAITPTYEFWTNWWKGLVLRGGAGFFIPYGHQSIDDLGARPSFIANLAAGYYFTPHNATPFGDLVFYLSANLVQTVEGPITTPRRSLPACARTSGATGICSWASKPRSRTRRRTTIRCSAR
jgi:hypothetical protein